MRKLICALGAAAMLAGGAVFAPAASAEEKTIRLALQPAPVLGYYVRDMQLLEKRGFKTEWSEFPASAPIFEAMAAGSVDMALVGTTPFLNVIGQDAGLIYVYDELANAVGGIVRSDSGITGPADLKGRKVAFPGKASQVYSQFLVYLEGSGVTEADIDLIRVNATDMNTLFARGEVDAALAWPPFTTEPIRRGEAVSLFTADDVMKLKNGHWIGSGWVARESWSDENGDALVAVLEALNEARQALEDNPAEVYAVMAEATGYTPETIQYMIEGKYTTHFQGEDTIPSAAAFKAAFETFEKYGAVSSDLPYGEALDAIVRPDFATKALANGQ